jgi:hypothetical protein
MRIRLKGLNSIRKKLADGTVKVYHYAWKSGPALLGEPGSPEFIASYNEAVARKVVPPGGTLLSLLQQYQASPEFVDLARSTRRSYIALIKRIEKKFSDFPLSALTDRRTRGIFKDWRDKIAAASGRRQAAVDIGRLSRVMAQSMCAGWGPRGHLSRLERNRRNPACSSRRHRTGNRHLHRPVLAKRACDPRCSLPQPRSGTRRKRHSQARKGNKNSQLVQAVLICSDVKPKKA